MKILYFTNVPAPYRVTFFNMLSEKNDLTVVFDKVVDIRNPDWYKDNEFKFKFKKLNKKYDLSGIKKLLKVKYDIIVIGTYASPNAAILNLYLKKKKIPFFINADGGFINYSENFLIRYIKKFFISKATWYLSTGKETNKYLEYYGAKKDNIFIYPFSSLEDKDILKNIVSKKEKILLRKKGGYNYKRLYVSVGSFIKRKGYDLFLEGIKDYNNDENGYLIIGGGTLRSEYEKMINNYKIKNVHLIDFCSKEEVLNYLKMSDVFFFPSREDIWGLVINEAMSVGLPVISSDNVISAKELIDEKFLFKNNDSKSIYEMIKYIDSLSETELEKVGNINLSKSVLYTIQNTVKEHTKIFEKVINLEKK